MENGKKQPIDLLELMDCKYIPAIYSGDKEKDNEANTKLYLQLLKEGEAQGFCPVLVDKEIKHYIHEAKYSDAGYGFKVKYPLEKWHPIIYNTLV